MTDLQITLFGAGGVFIVGVFSYNKWQEYKAKKSVERAFSTDHDDVLMREGDAPVANVQEPVLRQEPRFDAAPSRQGRAVVRRAAGRDRVRRPRACGTVAGGYPCRDGRGTSRPARARSERRQRTGDQLVDPLIDCLLPLSLEAPVRGDKILPVLQTLRLVGNKPVHFIGLHVNGDWEPITHGGVYTKMQGGVQLASRSTALNELEYSELVTRLRGVADEIGAEPKCPT